MRKLIAGIHRFKKLHWSANRELYQRLAEQGQFPEALFTSTCTPPVADRASATSLSQEGGSPRSAWSVQARTPRASMSWT